MLANLAEIITAYQLLQRSQYARNFYFDLHSALQLRYLRHSATIAGRGIVDTLCIYITKIRNFAGNWNRLVCEFGDLSYLCDAAVVIDKTPTLE